MRRPYIINEWSTETTKAYTSCTSLAALGVKVRELKLFEPMRNGSHISGFLVRDASGVIRQIFLNRTAPLSLYLRDPLAPLVPMHVAVTLDNF